MNHSLRNRALPSPRSTAFVLVLTALAVFALASAPPSAHATLRCAVADNGAGSADMPPQCEPSYGCPDGVFTLGTVASPVGLAIYLGSLRMKGLTATVHGAGGGLGGTFDEFTGSIVVTISGAGYFRAVEIPIALARMEHAPRVPFARIQSMAADLVLLQGQLPPGDPDFDLLRITAGTGFGMPSPGHTTLSRLPGGNWAVDSFFDITYRIDFVGAPGGPFGGMSNSSSSAARFQVGAPPRVQSEVPDFGGTAIVPPNGPDGYNGEPQALRLNGLPPGVPVTGTLHVTNVTSTEVPGGSLGGKLGTITATARIDFVGHGALMGWTRSMPIPVTGLTESGARFPGALLQSFPTDIVQLQGQIPPGDPDFDLLRITAGSGFGMPSPGHTTLTHLSSGNWSVDSFFDITYRIDFIGAPGGPFPGLSGSNTLTNLVVEGSTSSPVCVVPDNGGTAAFPVNAVGGYHTPSDALVALNGLPPGVPITGTMAITSISTSDPPGGATTQSLAGKLALDLKCALPTPYARSFSIPVTGMSETSPRTPGTTTQSFGSGLVQFQGQLPPGDPDFDLLRITAGSGFGLPSPGHTILTPAAGGNWSVDSFFDITYRIDFIGAPGGPFAGRSGSTTATDHFQAGDNATVGVPLGGLLALRAGPVSPNPARALSRMTISLGSPTHVVAGIYDVGGRRIRALEDGTMFAGEHALEWDGLTASGDPAAAGLYFYRVSLDGRDVSRKVALQR